MALSIKAEELFELGELTITNSLVSSVIVVSLIVLFYLTYKNKIKLVPSKFQLVLEWIVVSLYGLAKDIVGEKKANSIFPLIFTFFSFIILANWFGLLPITGSIGFAKASYNEKSGSTPLLIFNKNNSEDISTQKTHYELIPFFRSPTADLNFTIALAIISFILIQYTAISNSGVTYLSKYFDYRVKIGKGWKILMVPFAFVLNFAWKTLELLLEFSKIISFSFRLFGNIFAGEVLLAVITSLTFGLLTLPFIAFEIFVGFIQAIVFIFLTMVFIKVSTDVH